MILVAVGNSDIFGVEATAGKCKTERQHRLDLGRCSMHKVLVVEAGKRTAHIIERAIPRHREVHIFGDVTA